MELQAPASEEGVSEPAIASPWLAGRDRYERAMEGWVDNTHDDAFTHTVRLSDDDCAIELAAVCTPAPAYEVRAATARVLAGAVDPAVVEAFGRLGGTRMVGGFTRHLLELVSAVASVSPAPALGARPGTHPTRLPPPAPGAALLVDAGIEIARLARQAAKLPPSLVAGLVPGDARAFWELDTTGWSDLPGSCFTYSAAGRALLDTRPVSTSAVPALYSPAPGARRVFGRRKLSRLVRTGSRLDLFQAMHDEVHGFDLHYEVDLESRRIVAADLIASRLPYRGICDAPQRNVAAMVGERVDALLRKRTQTLLGGERGCAQLYDLTTDVLKLLAL